MCQQPTYTHPASNACRCSPTAAGSDRTPRFESGQLTLAALTAISTFQSGLAFSNMLDYIEIDDNGLPFLNLSELIPISLNRFAIFLRMLRSRERMRPFDVTR